jgi:hypothetical protein
MIVSQLPGAIGHLLGDDVDPTCWLLACYDQF